MNPLCDPGGLRSPLEYTEERGILQGVPPLRYKNQIFLSRRTGILYSPCGEVRGCKFNREYAFLVFYQSNIS